MAVSVNEYQICEICQPPCLICTSFSVCTLCAPRFALDSQGVCQPCGSGCIICGTESTLTFSCEVCDDGFALTYLNDEKYLSCTPCPQNCLKCKSVINTQTLTSSVTCVSCPIGWTMGLNESCFLCSSTTLTSGCMECNAQAECVSCFPEYILNTSGYCQNNNYSTKTESELTYVMVCIGLGSIMMVLLSNYVIIFSNFISDQIEPAIDFIQDRSQYFTNNLAVKLNLKDNSIL